MGRYGKALNQLFLALDRLYMGEEGRRRHAELFFPWDDKLITGIAFVDRDHKRLVEMVNTLHQAMKEGKGMKVIGPILDEFVAYTGGHFAREEAVFDKYNFPDTIAHKAIHNKLVDTVLSVVADYKAGNFAVGIDLLMVAKAWLLEHIMGQDMEFVPFFLKHGAQEPPKIG